MYAMTAVLLLACAAPAPFPRPARPVAWEGTWYVRWGGVPCRICLAPGGSYRCWWGSNEYAGNWRVRRGDLYLSERPINGTVWSDWRVRGMVPGHKDGKTGTADTAVRFSRQPLPAGP